MVDTFNIKAIEIINLEIFFSFMKPCYLYLGVYLCLSAKSALSLCFVFISLHIVFNIYSIWWNIHDNMNFPS